MYAITINMVHNRIHFTRCWDKDPSVRPSMDEVVTVMTKLFMFFRGFDEPVQFDEDDSSEGMNIMYFYIAPYHSEFVCLCGWEI